MKKKVFIFCLFIQFTFYANGVIIVDSDTGSYLNLSNSEVNVNVRNQVASITSSQVFINDLGGAFDIRYGFPMPENGTATQLRWRINNGEWLYADFSENDPTNEPGGGTGGGNVDPNLTSYLGKTPLYFDFVQSIENNDIIEVEIKYVQLLSYKFDQVTFEYPSDYSLIQSSIIENAQIINFNIVSDRTIDLIEMENESPEITNNGQIANLNLIVQESVSLSDTKIIYQLASDELGVISFSTLLDADIAPDCDDLGNGFLGLVIEPESNPNTQIIKKSFTLIIDKSGSMRGPNESYLKINQAKEAASFITNNLNFGDDFNIVTFSTDVDSFRSSPVEYNNANKQEALSYISRIDARGTTNISGSLRYSIEQLGVVDPDKVNIIVFFTDGVATIGETNTQGILDLVSNTISTNETELFLFTFGIGNDVTKDLLTRLGTDNNGFAQFLNDDQIEDVISDFYLTIRNPVLINPAISFIPDVISGIYPNPLPNLYKGQQLILTGRYSNPETVSMTLSGKAFNQDVTYTYDIDLTSSMSEENAFLPKLWAKSKIENLTTQFFSYPEGDPIAEGIKEEIEETSLCYQVLSQFTSFQDGSLSIEEFEEDQEVKKIGFSPNPFQEKTSAHLFLDAPKDFVFKVYDSTGKLVYSMLIKGEAGGNIIEWTGEGNNGTLLTPGLYFYQIEYKNKIVYFGKLLKA
ncbi:VWA domain-containing protein [Aquimarina sp. RZ0]|uniref:VWA domain-containing protein n=1 Tax=Aquimarina sp. RZ0 TaxID=2607730 RepID=UPI0011F3F915|nr:VWA domain-containing protein [Aquimarina sp. RZ0]KAA1245363.1 VWA domain-containing protein [Aquimarina sp. RZ0]